MSTQLSAELLESDFQIAPCLRSGPLSEAAASLITASRGLGETAWAQVQKAWCVPFLFNQMEAAASSGEDPAAQINRALEAMAETLRAASRTGFAQAKDLHAGAENSDASTREGEAQSNGVAGVTGEHYGQLFRAFSRTSYWDEPARLLQERLERNGLDAAAWKGRSVLDAGCGGGRYTVAWHLLGAGSATGIDISTTGLADARARVEEAEVRNVNFDQGSVLQLPYDDNAFDVVFSNGVLHHTTDWRAGIAELVRVLAPGGLGWLYLIEEPGGFFWDIIEVLRVVTKDVDRQIARNALSLIGMPKNRIFYMLDHVMVPINVRLTPQEIEACLREAGATDVRRLERGADFDRIEQIYQGRPFARDMYGVGENRHVFSKA